MEHTLSTPVAFIIFNRPDTTARVFEAIRQARPPILLVIADGPREDHSEDTEKCAATRAIIERVDWDCTVLTDFAEINLGCRRRVSSGLDWVFNTVEESIILEDDCLPHPTFFRFCEALLKRYKNDERVMAISGNNFQFGRQRTEYSYYFSRYPHCWGWATWRRAWHHHDDEMKLWPTIRDGKWLEDVLQTQRAVAYWERIFGETYSGIIDSWAYAWTFTCWIQSGLTILPNVNMVSNIGFSTEGTHTNKENNPFADIPAHAIEFPLNHPPFLIRDTKADHFTQKTHYDRGNLISDFRGAVKSLLDRIGVLNLVYPLYRRIKELVE